MGCVYLWLWHFKIPFEVRSLLLIGLSFITAIGFASLGYFINEFFDQRHDALAGKHNRITPLSLRNKIGLFTVILGLAFAPWAWLPSDKISWVLIATQVALLLAYSLPFPRLKSVPIVANILDMAYAYLVPLLLSFHTYAIFVAGQVPHWAAPFIVVVILVGLRNILIHQVDDLYNDAKARMETLPKIIGPRSTSYALLLMLMLETASFILFGTMLALIDPWMLSVPIIYAAFCFYRLLKNQSFTLPFLPLNHIRHLTDPYYQWCFPILILFAAASHDWRWMALLLVHLLILTPAHLIKPFFTTLHELWQWILRQRPIVRAATSALVNYPIYWLFRCFGIDLRQEKTSALGFLRAKLTM